MNRPINYPVYALGEHFLPFPVYHSLAINLSINSTNILQILTKAPSMSLVQPMLIHHPCYPTAAPGTNCNFQWCFSCEPRHSRARLLPWSQSHYVVHNVTTKQQPIITTHLQVAEGFFFTMRFQKPAEVLGRRATQLADDTENPQKHFLSTLTHSQSLSLRLSSSLVLFFLLLYGVYLSIGSASRKCVCVFMSRISLEGIIPLSLDGSLLWGLFRHSVTPLLRITGVHLCQRICLSDCFSLHSLQWLLSLYPTHWYQDFV